MSKYSPIWHLNHQLSGPKLFPQPMLTWARIKLFGQFEGFLSLPMRLVDFWGPSYLFQGLGFRKNTSGTRFFQTHSKIVITGTSDIVLR